MRVRQLSTSPLGREGSPEPGHAGPGSGTSSLQNYEKINVHCLRPPVCGALLWQKEGHRRVQFRHICESKMLLRGSSFPDSQEMGGRPGLLKMKEEVVRLEI